MISTTTTKAPKNDDMIILGRGFLGQALERSGRTVWGRDKFQLENSPMGVTPEVRYEIAKMLSPYKFVVNTIGKTDAKWCNDINNYGELMWSNADLAILLASICRDYNKTFIHVSTGCLYRSSSDPVTPLSPISADSPYLHSKMAAELGIRFANPDAIILRPRLIFSDFYHKNNWLCKLDKYKSFRYQPETATSTHAINAVLTILGHHKDPPKVINVGCNRLISPYQIATSILDRKTSPGFNFNERIHKSKCVAMENTIAVRSNVFYDLESCNKELEKHAKESQKRLDEMTGKPTLHDCLTSWDGPDPFKETMLYDTHIEADIPSGKDMHVDDFKKGTEKEYINERVVHFPDWSGTIGVK